MHDSVFKSTRILHILEQCSKVQRSCTSESNEVVKKYIQRLIIIILVSRIIIFLLYIATLRWVGSDKVD